MNPTDGQTTAQPSSATTKPAYLSVLSAAQYDAVTAPADEPLQILAGPGSGKTRVLVSRVAWLVLEKDVDPRDLVVVTFTNKAAKEMRVRLVRLIGQDRTNLLVLGTFHATCAKYLRKYASLVGIGNNFSICDSDETKRVIKAILKEQSKLKNAPPILGQLRAEVCMSEISRAKAKNQDVDAFVSSLDTLESSAAVNGRRPEPTAVRRAVAVIYKLYTEHLRYNNALDFDDLLVYGVQLLAENARVTANVQHVLVDEFQDTNTIQYDLMACFAGRGGSRGAVTIVGDPDQSIYGWRSAEVGNLGKMADEFALWSKENQIRRVFLEENYRSTGSVLKAAKGIIESSSSRIDRGLFTKHAPGPAVVLQQFSSSQMEAMFISTEIKRLIANAGGLLGYDDFAILLRFNALSREVEQQLLRENIPSRIMGGARFFDRKEVKDILAYLLLADNPHFTPALDRVINVPKRSIGEKSVKDLHEEAKKRGTRTMNLVEEVARSEKPIMGVKASLHKNLQSFVAIVHEVRELATKDTPVPQIIDALIRRTNYEAHLKKEPDFEQRWENVKELINFSGIIAFEMQSNAAGEIVEDGTLSMLGIASSSSPLKQSQILGRGTSSQDAINLDSSDEEDAVEPRLSPSESKRARKVEARVEQNANAKVEEMTVTDGAEEAKTPLRIFLEACTLSTDMEEKEQDGKHTPKVTIATAHAAKGLEFPVVFVVSVEEGTYPFYRSTGSTEEIDEEARLLYVAVTRAQTQAYLTHCAVRFVNGEEMSKTLSPFVARVADSAIFLDGRWKKDGEVSVLPQPGGFMSGAPSASHRRAAAEKVDFGSGRPIITEAECSLFAAVLGRAAPSKVKIEEMIRTFEESDIATRSKRVDADCHRYRVRPSSSKSRSGLTIDAARSSGASLFAKRELSPSSTVPSGMGIQSASTLISRINSNSNLKSRTFLSESSTSYTPPSSGPFLSRSSGFTLPLQTFRGNENGTLSKPLLSASSPLTAGTLSGVTRGQKMDNNSAMNTKTNHLGRAPSSTAAKRLGAGRGPMAYPKKPRAE